MKEVTSVSVVKPVTAQSVVEEPYKTIEFVTPETKSQRRFVTVN